MDYSLKSYRRPESGGPKDRHNGKTLRELEMELHTKQRNPGILSNGTGPGYYRADIAKDRTQSRRVPQPVTAAFKRATGGRNRAECVSVTMLTGHHWRERVPRLGEGDGEDGGGMGTAWPHLVEEASDAGNGRRLATSAEYRKVQVRLDSLYYLPVHVHPQCAIHGQSIAKENSTGYHFFTWFMEPSCFIWTGGGAGVLIRLHVDLS